MDPRLTIIMPLKGRRLFTFRCLWHANELRLPYHFLLADGLAHEEVSRRLKESRAIFPHLDIEYVRYPDDTDYSRFWAKMADAYARVRTPYVMNMDNDDFAGRYGIERAIDFLENNPDYICARGRSVDFSVYSWSSSGCRGGLCGKFNRLATAHNYKDVTAATPAERLREGGLCHAVYSAVFRTGAAALIWREIAEINFSDLMLQENFVALRALTLGKVRIDQKTVSKYPQIDTGISHEFPPNWGSHLLRSRFTTDAQAMISRIASAADTGATSAVATAEDVRAILESYYHGYLSAICGARARLKSMVRRKWPRLVNAVQMRPRLSVRCERAELYSRLKKAGANAEDIRLVRKDLEAIERALSPGAFAEYAGPLLPLAKSEGGREWLYV